jgi:cell division protein FtsN
MSQQPPRDPSTPPKRPGYVSPKERYDEEEKQSNNTSTFVAIGMIAAIVVIGGWLAFSMMSGGKPQGAGHTANAEETPAEETPAAADTAGQDSAAAAAAAAMAAERANPPAPKPATPPPPKKTETAAETPAAPPEPKFYGIEVGTYLFEDRAGEIRDQMASATSLEAKVVPRTSGGETSYAVVLGSFPSKGDAESKGAELLGAGSIKQSKVVAIKK